MWKYAALFISKDRLALYAVSTILSFGLKIPEDVSAVLYGSPDLKLQEHIIRKARFPVIDFHTHFGPSFLGENFDTRYDTKMEVERLQEMGIQRVVNLEGFWGDTLDRILKKAEGFEDFFITFCSIDVRRIDEPSFASYVKNAIRGAKHKGARGLKLDNRIPPALF